MSTNCEISYAPGPSPNTVLTSDGRILTAPEGWILLPPGDAALTRRVKAAGDHWTVQEKKGRKIFSRGVWAPSESIQTIRAELLIERASPKHQKRTAANVSRREKTQTAYEKEFYAAVLSYLAFHPKFADLAECMARAVADHATPVGSGTVARTQRIPLEARAEAAVLAWMRHHTTDYESRAIPRIRGKRREVRRMLAQSSKQMLSRYRKGDVLEDGVLERALLMVSERKGDSD